MADMNLNDIVREVFVSEPNKFWSGIYTVKANYHNNHPDALKKKELFAILSKEGLDFSGAIYDSTQYGFNDRKVMGQKEAKQAKKDGKSNVWINLDGHSVSLEVLETTVKGLKKETHLQYAQRVLDKVVTFVENEKNYKVK